MGPEIRRLNALPADMEKLRLEARIEGFRFVDRLVDEWETGDNRFEGPGEIFIGAFVNQDLVGFGGLNVDPYRADPRTGRIRRIYVARKMRRQGVARAILTHLIEAGKGHFDAIRLQTDTSEGAALYEAIGFARCDEETASHRFDLSGVRGPSARR